MKIIDEKGRLFGKINLIDALVVLIVAAVAVVFVVKGVGAGRPADPAAESGMEATGSAEIEFTVFCNGFNQEISDAAMAYAERFANNEENQIMNSGEFLDAYITKIEQKPYLLTETDEQGESYAVVDQARSSLVFTIRATAEISGYAYSVGKQEIRVGKSYIVKTPELEYNGVVTGVEAIHE